MTNTDFAPSQAYASKILGVQSNKVVARVKRLGGGFGGKETRSIPLSSTVALAAKKTRRPVRCMLTREEDMVTIAVTRARDRSDVPYVQTVLLLTTCRTLSA